MITDIVHSLAHYGPRRFYTLNTGISTLRPLAQAATDLAKDASSCATPISPAKIPSRRSCANLVERTPTKSKPP
jgi:hypothetical protein